jgi:hypothetical protein
MAATVPLEVRTTALERVRARVSGANLAALVAFVVAAVIYVRTMLPGVSFGDWAESEYVPSMLGILHPTSYPLYTLVQKAFSLIPYESLAWRANFMSGMAAAGVVGMAVLIAVRLGVRPLVAVAAALSLAVTGTLWEEATFSEMNSFHLLLVALLVHRALVWRAERRDRDLVIGALLGGLCVSNHGLAITVVPIIVVFVLIDARREIAASPLILGRMLVAFVVGLTPYLYLPLRALVGPPEVYGRFLTWNGFFDYVSGAQFRGDMHFTSIESVRAAVAALPRVGEQLVSLSDIAYVVLGFVGLALILRRAPWFGLLLVVLGVVNTYFYANYLGDLPHYLLTTWLILAIGLAVAGEAIVTAAIAVGERVAGWRPDPSAYAALVLPILLLASNWSAHDQSANHDGEAFTAEVFAALPPNAVLLTYWDALTPLAYEHCVEGVRPDVSLRAYDEAALVTCDPVERPLTAVAERRPVFALMVQTDGLAQDTGLMPVPLETIKLPWGQRFPELDRSLYRLVPSGQAP